MAAMNFHGTPPPGGRRRLRCERGAELVEFALVFPMLLLVMLGMADFGFLFQRYEVLTAAAREGARVAILPGYTDPDVTTRVNAYLTAGGLTQPVTVTVLPVETTSIGTQCISVRPVRVTYVHQYMFIGPMLAFFGEPALGTPTLNATSAMRTENAAETCS